MAQAVLSAAEVSRQFSPIYQFLKNKWYFDELYNAVFVQPTLFISRRIAEFDKKVIDRFIDSLAKATRIVSLIDDLIDRYIVDGMINWFARRTYRFGHCIAFSADRQFASIRDVHCDWHGDAYLS